MIVSVLSKLVEKCNYVFMRFCTWTPNVLPNQCRHCQRLLFMCCVVCGSESNNQSLKGQSRCAGNLRQVWSVVASCSHPWESPAVLAVPRSLVWHRWWDVRYIRCSVVFSWTTLWVKNGTSIVFALTLADINWFSNFFHCWIHQEICNKMIAALLTTP